MSGQNPRTVANLESPFRDAARTTTTGTLRLLKPEPKSPSLSPERLKRVADACKAWISKLIDPSRRNNLLFFRQLKQGTLDLTSAPDATIALLLSAAEESVPLDHFVVPSDLQTASARLQGIRRQALANEEERGLETLHLALGLATWPAADGGRPYAAPVFLLPIAVEQQGTERRRMLLRRDGDVQPNLVLLHYLENQGIQIEADALVQLVEGDDEGERFDLEPAFEMLRARCGVIPEFAIQRSFVLGNFSFQKMAMVQDLRLYPEGLAAHDLIAGIAQDAEAAAAARGDRTDVDPAEIDRQSPDQEFLILDADSTQQRAIACALSGQNGVISGPPGTGKSQTIANLIAETAARGQRVLFVAEKRAALEAVYKRLDQKGLGHLCLDLHGAGISRAKVIERIAHALEQIRGAPVVDPSEVHRRYVERRQRLNRHVHRMHIKRECGLSVYELQGRLLRLPNEATCTTRWRDDALRGLDATKLEQATQLLQEAAAFEDLVHRTSPSPWTGIALASPKDAQRIHDQTRELTRTWHVVTDAAAAVEAAGLRPSENIDALRSQIDLLSEAQSVLAALSAEVFGERLSVVRQALRPAAHTLTRWWATLVNSDYRQARSEAAGWWLGEATTPAALLVELNRVDDVWTRWCSARLGAALPTKVSDVDRKRDALEVLRKQLGEVDAVVNGRLAALPLADAEALLRRLAEDAVTPYQQARVIEIERELGAIGVGALLDEIRKDRTPAAFWDERLRFAWLRSCLDAIQVEEPDLASFKGKTHQKIADEFQQLDVDRLKLTVSRVHRTHAENVIRVRNAHPQQDSLVKREAAKKRRHLPLRKVFREAPDVMTALHPCWMASPLSVSQLLPGDRQYFDLVIFDEASQVLPEDAVTSLYRGRHAVVAGDRRQLPPTTFFASGTEEEGEEESATGGFESLLDVMSSFLDPAWGLDWHYRSRDESLIAFSNHHVYGGRLVTFPGAGGEPAIAHVLVPHRAGPEGEESSSAEVQRVVELVLEHAEKRPDETLGVIAMGLAHALRVEAAVDRALQERPELAEFFDTQKPDRFFVKNLERVQGDEREAIILTVGYGKDASGKLPYRFGPLLQDGGERRLNVAVTRARSRMTVVSSFSHLDMDLGRSNSKGVALLRAYLEYAANGGRRQVAGEGTEVPLNDFEQAVKDALTARGYKLLPQWGASRYRIDLVAQHPERPGEFVLAVECDGATYHSSYTARDRDRLRQQHLEALGWRFHRIWSTDWFRDREAEIERFRKAFDAAVVAADAGEGGDVRKAYTSRLAEVPPAPAEVHSTRGGRPSIPRRRSIDDYTRDDLDRFVRWVLRGPLKTDEELIPEIVRELGFQRRGSRIDATIRESIRRVRSRG